MFVVVVGESKGTSKRRDIVNWPSRACWPITFTVQMRKLRPREDKQLSLGQTIPKEEH
jgi:hypothetical protein